MRILFRTAGGRDVKKQLGMGHIFRCINLSKEFKKNQVYFLTEDFGSVNKTLRDYEEKLGIHNKDKLLKDKLVELSKDFSEDALAKIINEL